MRLFESPDGMKRFRRASWKFQRTFHTPLKDLSRFVGVMMPALPAIESAQVIFDQVVFEPQYKLLSLYSKYSLQPKWYGDGITIEAEGRDEASELLVAVLSEWIDFMLVPKPKDFVIYADHDEYITFFAQRKMILGTVAEQLKKNGYRQVDWIRKF